MTPALLRNFETLILPEVEVLSSELSETIREWVPTAGR